MFRELSLHPAPSVEVIESEPSLHSSVWLCESYVVHHPVSTELRCIQPTCVVHHGAQGGLMSVRSGKKFCTDIHFGSEQRSFVPTRRCKRRFCMFVIKFSDGVQCSVVSLSGPFRQVHFTFFIFQNKEILST